MSPDFFGKNCKIKGPDKHICFAEKKKKMNDCPDKHIYFAEKKKKMNDCDLYFFNLSSVVILQTIVFVVHPYDTKSDVINTERKKSGYFLLIQDEHVSTFTGIFCVLSMLLSWRDHANEESFQLDSVFFTVLVRAR